MVDRPSLALHEAPSTTAPWLPREPRLFSLWVLPRGWGRLNPRFNLANIIGPSPNAGGNPTNADGPTTALVLVDAVTRGHNSAEEVAPHDCRNPTHLLPQL